MSQFEEAERSQGGVREAATGAAEQVREKAGEAADLAREKAGEATSRAGEQVRSQVDQRTTQLGEQARSVASALRESAQGLEDEQRGAARVTEGAADRLERLGSYLARVDGDSLVRDVEDFGRRRPWLLAGAGLAVGFVASRFLKASSERRYEARPAAVPAIGGSYEGGTA